MAAEPKIMNDKLKISSRQKQIIIGKLLGDGHLETANSKTYRLKIEHSFNQRLYVDWLYQELKSLASAEPKLKLQIVKGIEYKKYWFNTHYSGSFRFYARQFYQGKTKIAPQLIDHWLTPLALAVWFMDDGSVKSKECQGKILNTQSFDAVSLERLQQALDKNFRIRTSLRKQKEGFQIYILAGETKKLRQTIGKYVLASMRYKLG